MSYKHLLKFYFFADGLNEALDSVTLRFAKASADCFKGCEYYADKICDVIEAKCELNKLWAFLDGALSSMTEENRLSLKQYCIRRGKCSAAEGADGEAKALHRALMKFSRRVSGKIERYAKQVNVLRNYYCLLGAKASAKKRNG